MSLSFHTASVAIVAAAWTVLGLMFAAHARLRLSPLRSRRASLIGMFIQSAAFGVLWVLHPAPGSIDQWPPAAQYGLLSAAAATLAASVWLMAVSVRTLGK